LSFTKFIQNQKKMIERNEEGKKSLALGSNNEEILVRSAIGGSSEAFAELIKLYYRRVFALGMSFFKNQTDTEDFIQDVFIKVYTKISTFKGESLFSTWLTRIAYTTALNSIKRRKEYLPLSDETLLFDIDWTPEEREIRRLTIEVVRQTMKELPENYAICLDLYFFYDMPYAEICKVMDVPLNTVKSYIFRAKKLLREKLEKKL